MPFLCNSTAECSTVNRVVEGSNPSSGATFTLRYTENFQVYTMVMRNYCGRCMDILVDPTEFRWGYCLICISIMLEEMDYRVADLYWDDFDDAI